MTHTHLSKEIMLEDTYGIARRLDFIVETIQARGQSVLDVGCGTGSELTVPLAKLLPNVQFIAIDSDKTSIEIANRRYGLRNLQFAIDVPVGSGKFDVIIASEVIEHVEQPDAFINYLGNYLTQDGRIILTVPNGYGPSEWASLMERIMRMIGMFGIIRFTYRTIRFLATGSWERNDPKVYLSSCDDDKRLGQIDTELPSTLAVSPHVNFFSFNMINKLIKSAGYCIETYEPRIFVCGFGWSNIISALGLIDWNVQVAKHLPHWMVSDWMFVLKKSNHQPFKTYKRGLIAMLRRWINKIGCK